MFRVALALVVLVFLPTSPAWAWGRGHKLIRAWAVARLPAEQKKWLGDSHLQRLCTVYSSIQDEFAGGGPSRGSLLEPHHPRASSQSRSGGPATRRRRNHHPPRLRLRR